MMLLESYAMQMVGIQYKWDGKNALAGFDCSGLVSELLKSACEPIADGMNAQMLFDWYSDPSKGNGEWNRQSIGALAFFGESPASVTHVAMLLDQYRIIEAGHGDHLVLTKDDAAAKGAVVRLRSLKYRKDLVGIIRPKYVGIGCI